MRRTEGMMTVAGIARLFYRELCRIYGCFHHHAVGAYGLTFVLVMSIILNSWPH